MKRNRVIVLLFFIFTTKITVGDKYVAKVFSLGRSHTSPKITYSRTYSVTTCDNNESFISNNQPHFKTNCVFMITNAAQFDLQMGFGRTSIVWRRVFYVNKTKLPQSETLKPLKINGKNAQNMTKTWTWQKHVTFYISRTKFLYANMNGFQMKILTQSRHFYLRLFFSLSAKVIFNIFFFVFNSIFTLLFIVNW